MEAFDLLCKWRRQFIFISLHLLCLGCLAFLEDHLLQKMISNPWYTGLYLIVDFATIYQYFYTSGSDPGYVADMLRDEQSAVADIYGHAASRSVNTTGQINGVSGYSSSSSSGERRCDICHVHQYPRSYHCHVCNKCVIRFDHHCTAIGTCVGYRNHSRFWWYIFLENLFCLWTAVMYTTCLGSAGTNSWVHAAVAIFFIIALVFFELFFMVLLIFHSYLVLTNQTSFESKSYKRHPDFRNLPYGITNPYNKGYMRNIYSFCFEDKRTYERESIPDSDVLETRSRQSFCDRLYFNLC